MLRRSQRECQVAAGVSHISTCQVKDSYPKAGGSTSDALVLDKLELKEMQLYFPFLCSPQWTFVPLELFFLQNLASAVQTTPSCSGMFMNFSQKVLTLPLWEILSEAFPCGQTLMNPQRLFWQPRASLRCYSDRGQGGKSPPFKKRNGGIIMILKN